ncbi:MAG: hypothetical protein Q7S58_10700 [Candidatus Binatus sp.]|uniref:hypothetical protein n=1 Tax=Candidatus Binatus sp. TaxID=2811406 RepID=UPI0027222B62|nr:hypothetical protein [Candidatus Binatus sp.]MDO8432863.1 hypothetical protein [Candidatus Binatus sp.]
MKRVCVPCAKAAAIIERAGGEVGLAGLVDIFIAEGLSRGQVDVVLDAQIGEEPTWRDRLTSNMTNTLMRNLGMPGRQSPEDVMRVRTAMRAGGGAGTWQAGEEPPEGH